MAILLLVIVADAAALVLYSWTTWLAGETERAAQSGAKPLAVCLRVIGAEKTWEGADGVSYAIWLMNCGDSTLHLDYVHVLAPDGTIVHTYYAGDWPVAPGSTEYLWLWIPKSAVDSEESYVVKIVTKEGVEAYTSILVQYSP